MRWFSLCAPFGQFKQYEQTFETEAKPSMRRSTVAMTFDEDTKIGGQGRVKDPARDRRLAQNRKGPTGQGQVRDPRKDRRLAENRPGPTGQGTVRNPGADRRLSANRPGPTGQGRVKDPERDRRLSENRAGPTGQGRVKDPARDRRLRDNRMIVRRRHLGCQGQDLPPKAVRESTRAAYPMMLRGVRAGNRSDLERF